MIKALLLVGLFNIHSGAVHDVKVVAEYTGTTAWQQCAKDLMKPGPQVPDKNGDVKLYECVVPDAKTTMGLANIL
jgi:hypothetical protein